MASKLSDAADSEDDLESELPEDSLHNPNPAPDLFKSDTPSIDDGRKKVRRKLKREEPEETGGSRIKSFLGRMVPGGSDS